MSVLKKMPIRVRILLCAVAAALASLFLGAIRNQDSVRAQMSERENSGIRCRTILLDWNRAVPERERTAWDKLTEEDPVTCLHALCSAGMR